MKCRNCGIEISDTAAFCKKCGCAVVNEPDEKKQENSKEKIQNLSNDLKKITEDMLSFYFSEINNYDMLKEKIVEDSEKELHDLKEKVSIREREIVLLKEQLASKQKEIEILNQKLEMSQKEKKEEIQEIPREVIYASNQIRCCPNCGNRITDDMVFCAECGTRVV